MVGSSAPASEEELEEMLEQSLLQAYSNGIEISGEQYVLRHDEADVPDWEVEIIPVKNSPSSGDP